MLCPQNAEEKESRGDQHLPVVRRPLGRTLIGPRFTSGRHCGPYR